MWALRLEKLRTKKKEFFENHFAYIFYDFLKVTMSEKICKKKTKLWLKFMFLNIFKKP